MISTLAIIGGGATGVGALMAAIQHEVAGSIYVIDPRPIGGVVFGTTDDEIICNTSVDITTLDPDNEDDFLEYLKSRQLNVSKTSYTTRRMVGEYIKDRFHEYSEKAKLTGIDVKYLNLVCRKVLINNYKYQLVLSDGFRQEELNAESVIICTGHGAPKVPCIFKPYSQHATFARSPYPETDMLAKVPKNSEVLVVGSKQSAIDATLLLCREGHRVTMTSPSGELPAVRTRLIPGDRFPIDRGALMQLMSLWDPNDPQLDITRLRLKYIRYLAKEMRRLGDIPVSRQLSNSSSSIRRLEEEINISERNYCKWESAVVGFVEAINDIHIRDFKESIFNVEPEFKRKLMRYIASIAVPNARKVLKLLYNDNLCIKRGEVTAVEMSHARVKPWKVAWEDDERQFDAVVCAAGFENHRYSFDEAGALILDNEGQPQGSVIDFADDLSIRNPRTNEKENIWVSGSATHLKIMTSSAVFLAIPQVRLAINELKRRILCSNKDGGVDEKIAV